MTKFSNEGRDCFSSKFGIICAAAGSAIGLGNIWRFPYIAGESGGGAFLIIYLFFIIILGIPVMMSEFAIGRRGRKNAYGSFKALAPKTAWPLVGLMGIVAAFVILAFYSTISGWTIEYLIKASQNAFEGKSSDELNQMFTAFQTSSIRPIILQLVFIFLTAAIIVAGIKNGIEKYTKLLMPFLLLLLIVLAIRSVTLDGAIEGLSFLFYPDFSSLNARATLNALGQAAFSLSIGMGALITYGSYIPDKNNITSISFNVSIADVFIAILAGVAIFPAVFALGLSPTEGPGLIFMIIPSVFMEIPGGYIFGIIFFFLLTIAALTSSISILEVVVAFCVEEFKLKRTQATIIAATAAAFVGLFCTLSWSTFENVTLFDNTIFDILDYSASNVLLPLGALFIVIFIGWQLSNKEVKDELSNGGELKLKLYGVFNFLIKFIAPIAIAIVFLYGIGLIKI